MNFEDSIKHISIKFQKLGFELTECKDLGMHKHAIFSNNVYSFYYSYDRGGIELVAKLKDDKRLDILRILNWLYKEKNKYKFLKIGQLNDDLTINYYGEIFVKEFDLINHFLSTATENDLKAFEENQTYEGAKYWSQIFIDKGRAIPESLKTILERHKTN